MLPTFVVRLFSLRPVQLLAASVFLVSVPVFFQAPLVRAFPVISLLLTLVWLGLSALLLARPVSRVWGDLLFGFTWTWLAGSVYWGWFRWEPLLHLPIESIGMPIALIGLACNRGLVGHWFYLGSLLGTAITDFYFYGVGLIPHWRQLMRVDPSIAKPIFQDAIALMHTQTGIAWAVVLVSSLLLIGLLPLRSSRLHWWTFGGAVLSTVLVDGLFLIVATTV
ncbi:MAG: DUF3120 domain-containing protein [Elainellaceae cyanobacterium]